MNSRYRCAGCKKYKDAPPHRTISVQKFCSDECVSTVVQKRGSSSRSARGRPATSKKPRSQRPLKTCQNCGKPFETSRAQKFCSVACRNEDRKKRGYRPAKVDITCDHCGKTFQRRTSKPGLPYCSRECRTAAGYESPPSGHPPKTGKTINCDCCGEPFYVSGSRLKNGARFCSRACAGRWASEQPRLRNPLLKNFPDNSGKKNGKYKHGRYVGKSNTTTNKRKVRTAVAERDGDWCLLCGRPPKGLHLHRVKYGSQGGKYETGNCVQLCGLHHDVVHSNKRLWQPLLYAYLDDQSEENIQALRCTLEERRAA